MKLKKLSVGLIFLITLMNYSSLLHVSGAGTLTVNIYNCDGYNLPGLGGNLQMIVYDSSWNYVTSASVSYSGGESFKTISLYQSMASGFIEIYQTANTGRGSEFWGGLAVTFPGSYNFYRDQPYQLSLTYDDSTLDPGDDLIGTILLKNPGAASAETRPTIYFDRDHNLPDDYNTGSFSSQIASAGGTVGWNFNFGPITVSGDYDAYVEIHKLLSSWVLTDSSIWVSPFTVSAPGSTTLYTADGFITADNTPYLDWSTATGADSYQIQIDDYSSFSTPIIDATVSSSSYTTSTLSDDVYYWRIRAKDSYNNYGPWTTYRIFEVDTTGPSPPTLSSPSNGDVFNDPTVYLDWSSVSDADLYQVQVDDYTSFATPVIDTTTSSSSYTTGSLSEGIYYWRIRCQDDLGNWGNWGSYWSFTHDETGCSPPSLVSPSNGVYVGDSTPYLDWNSVTDAVNYRVQVDGGTSYTTTGTSYTWSTLSQGTHSWHVQAEDAAGNWGIYSTSWSFIVDTVPPDSPVLSSPSNGAIFQDTTPYLDWGSAIGAVNYRVQVDDNSGFSSPTTYETSNTYYTWSSLSDGTYYWHVQAEDGAGNWGDYSSYWSFTVDNDGPDSPVLSSPSNGAIFQDTTPYLDWGSAIGAVNYRVQVDDNSGFSSPTTYETSNTYYTWSSLSDGTYYWHVQAEDGAGNWGVYSSYWSFTIDIDGLDSPVLSLPTNGAILTDAAYTFQWGSVTDTVSYQIQISGPTNIDTTTASTSYDATGLMDGSYTWQVRCQDGLGNWGSWSTAWSFTIDTVGPDSPVLSLPSSGAVVAVSSYNFQWTSVGDAVSYQIQIGGPTNIDTTTASTSYDANGLTDGSYTWQVRCQDTAGNWGPWSSSWSFTVTLLPNTAPGLSNEGISPSVGDTNTLFTFSVTYTDAEGDAPNYIYVNIEGVNYAMTFSSGTYTTGAIYTFSTTLSEGVHNYYFTVSDGEFVDTTATDSVSVTPPMNTAPVLSDPTVSPGTGDTDTIFTFSVIYTDEENDTPSYLLLYLDGESHTMVYSSGSYETGAFYTYGTSLSAGDHTYYFATSDGEFITESASESHWVDTVGPVSTINLLSPVDNAYLTDYFDLPIEFETTGETFVRFWYELDETAEWFLLDPNGTFCVDSQGLHSILIRGLTVSGINITSNSGSFVIAIIPDVNAQVEITISTSVDERFLEGDYVLITITLNNTGTIPFWKIQIIQNLINEKYRFRDPYRIDYIENLAVGEVRSFDFMIEILETTDFLHFSGRAISSLGEYLYSYDIYPGEDSTVSVGDNGEFQAISAFSSLGLNAAIFVVAVLLFTRRNHINFQN